MEMTSEKKSAIMSELLQELLSTMKGSAGERLKPREVEMEITMSDHKVPDGDEGEDKPGLKEHLDKVAAENPPEELDVDDLEEEEDEEPDEKEMSPAYARMQKRLKKQ